MSKLSKLSRLWEDKGNWWVLKIDGFRMNIFRFFSGFFTRVNLFFRGVKVGQGSEFFGLLHVRRFSFSKIDIGRKCTFRSDQTSNLIGVNRKCILSTHEQDAIIAIGNNCGFSGVTIGAAREIRIGNNVLCGANVVITDFDWHPDISNTEPEPVIIHDNVWIGLNSVILKGVEIGENTIIGANSLVLRSIPANVVAGGNPCKVLKEK
ncbi:MAG TPA: acyltransferase [Chitinophagaceae bacterium]|nr:acyltransferase [Chitinophagaceae bacterium]